MALSITAEADALALERVRASAVLDEAELTLAGVPFKQVVPTRLRLQDGYASIVDLHWDSLGNAIRASGGTNITADEPRVDLVVNGGLDLRLLGAFATDIATGGTAQADFTVSGPLRSPDVVGRIGVTNGELRLDTPRVVASELEGSVRVDESRIATISMAGTVNGGAAEINGEIDVTTIGDPRGRVTLSARNVALEYPGGPSDGIERQPHAHAGGRGRHAGRARRRPGRLVSRTAPRLQPGAFGLAPGHRLAGAHVAVSLAVAARSLAGLGRRRPHRQQLRAPGPLDPSPDRRHASNGRA